MSTLTHQRCLNHAAREAVARCPECARFFCRECITEHDDRVLCTSCLKRLTQPQGVERRSFAGLRHVIQCSFGVLLAWFFFFLIGQTLGRLSYDFHEGVVWQVPWIEPK
jgi:hypothetical protein